MTAEQDVAEISKLIVHKESEQQDWAAELHLGFVRKESKTLLAHRSYRGPLTVQRPFYPEGGLCHVYILHPPGGVVAGDKLLINVQVASAAEALLTTPAAGKFYRSEGKQAAQRVALNIEQGAVLEWLPQETIIYQGARLASTVKITLENDACFIAWEILAFGRPASGEGFECGEALLKWQIFRNGQALYLESMHLDAQAFNARWGLNRHSSCGTLFACPATPEHLDKVRVIIGDSSGRGVTLMDDLLICRASDDKTEAVRRFFENVRTEIRQDIVRCADHTPRIWAT
ncbi:urease accessory protein UreD [Methyloprofundus sedimenti]|uniref:Urease accessory protein UreD n=1 Tax=Methyloprofundus sedimenti TaxID=1420851 RepID=A0A1V8M1U6_9GAMM|nr:urease accessory protein UreD [Methyloprofundus sedimenti]OQK15527.1 urease accessory protein UreD [Methyloprofundus sedimenti]